METTVATLHVLRSWSNTPQWSLQDLLTYSLHKDGLQTGHGGLGSSSPISRSRMVPMPLLIFIFSLHNTTWNLNIEQPWSNDKKTVKVSGDHLCYTWFMYAYGKSLMEVINTRIMTHWYDLSIAYSTVWT